MKRIAVLLIALCSFAFSQAQSPLSFGPKVGFTTSKLSIDKDDVYESFRTNFLAGIFLRIGNKIYFQTEANFAPKGGIFNSENVDFDARSIKMNTIEVPLLLGVKIIDLKVANLRLMAGPVASYVIDKEIILRSGAIGHMDESILKDLIWGIQGGIGMEVLMFTMAVRYEWGLSDIYDQNGFQMKQSLFNVSLGWKLL
ncbi:MAG: porin family protein [Bacteroidales bacterium]|nr:porin family protein [Bacteroidales bacterium]MDZ4205464.1 porin family protein [Bacteroidales bacterium]